MSNAVIPRAELTSQLITVEAFQHYVIGFPQRIEGAQYERNMLQFNFCFVLKPLASTATFALEQTEDVVSCWQHWQDQSAGTLSTGTLAAYELLVSKINSFFKELEEDCSVLSQELFSDYETSSQPESKLSIHLNSIFDQLHACGMCEIPFENYGSLYLHVSCSLFLGIRTWFFKPNRLT